MVSCVGVNMTKKRDSNAAVDSQMASMPPQMEKTGSSPHSLVHRPEFQGTRLPPQRTYSSRKKSAHFVDYSFEDFPIMLNGTFFQICNGNYSVSLSPKRKFDGILISVKRGTSVRPTVCAIVSFKSSDSHIRSAVKECADHLELSGCAVSDGQRHPVSHCSVSYLADHYIVVLDKISEHFSEAIYYCSLCDFHLVDIRHVKHHFITSQHFTAEQHIKERTQLLEKLPNMSTKQLEAINTLINKIIRESDENVKGPIWKRSLELSHTVEELFHRTVFPEMGVIGRIQVYGSVSARTAIDSSDLNLSIDIPKCDDPIEAMKRITEVLNKASDSFNASLVSNSPLFISFTMSNVNVRIAWRCENGVKLGNLLSVYTEVRPQYADLCRVVRKWAKVSGICSSENRQNGLTSYAFDLMVLYFLQQSDLLPCLHEMRPVTSHERKTDPMIEHFYVDRDSYENDIHAIIAKFERPYTVWDIGQLYVDFLRFYALRIHADEVIQVYTRKRITKDQTHWSKKLLQICDPFRTDNIVSFTKHYQPYFFNCFLKSYLYFAIPQTQRGPLIDITLYQKLDESNGRRKKIGGRKGSEVEAAERLEKTTCQKSTLAGSTSLFNGDVDDDEYTAAADAVVEDGKLRAEIEKKILKDLMETSSVHNILLKDLNSENVEIDSILVYSRRTMNRIRRSNPTRIDLQVYRRLKRLGLACREYSYRNKEVDAMHQFRRQKIIHEEKRRKMRAQLNKGELKLLALTKSLSDDLSETELQGCLSRKMDKSAGVCGVQQVNGLPEFAKNIDDNEVSVTGMEVENIETRVCYDDFHILFKDYNERKYKKKINELDAGQFTYTFESSENFNNGYMPQIVCSICEKTGHWSEQCTLMNIPLVEDLNHTKEDFEWTELDNVIMGSHEGTRIKSECDLNRQVRLKIFGSLLSGFGVVNSDIDICFRFQEDVQPLEVDSVGIVQDIALSLKKMRGIESVGTVIWAKVPIVKFTWKDLGVEGDISYYNVLALRNTEMLREYCQWDHRVAPLGVWVKRWAKSCDIGDASRGSLSSYAYIILLIHYLQNCDPPVVPRLQEDFRNDETEPVIVDDCDVYFHRGVIDGWSENRMSVGKLFTGFLDYYARFDFETKVVQIRRKKPLRKCEKAWNRPLCIEDPFDLAHNLGSGVSNKMYVFIIQNIHNSRKNFLLSDIRNDFLKLRDIALEGEMPHDCYDSYGSLLLESIEHFAENDQRHEAEQSPQRNGSKLEKSHTGSNRNPARRPVFGTQIHLTVGRGVFNRRGKQLPQAAKASGMSCPCELCAQHNDGVGDDFL
ncbi:hypothetical protein KIN20_015514 [Parelaphostrongylus tenuis]|uniref:PAP-associated domain-containing protein n=1 Tax=Parelaphostrongylus tenuis TaxID=148309 RepID=A0AAD5MJQ0_PARTN|nr:hypothetical protein KIN20_015514 [Parelaphostrongylus tenuis]